MKKSLTENRPWGKFHILHEEENFKVKKIEVDSNMRLSYQFHDYRSEYWIIIKGKALITIDDESKEYEKGEVIYIPKMARHRVKNIGRERLVFVEVQTGSYFGEDDITRIEDDFNRD